MCAAPILEMQDVHVRFGGVHAIAGLSFAVNRGEILSVIGPNGAGKTSVFNCILYLLHMLINGIAVGALYGVVAMCFVLIYKTSRAINLAQGEFVLVGAWLCWWLLAACHLPFMPGLLLTLVFMPLFGALIQIIVLRPLLGRPAISVIMATIGLSIFLQALMKWMFGVFAQPFPHVFLATTLPIFGIEIRTVYVFSLVASLLIMGGLALFFKLTRWGLAMRATEFDQQVALSLGIPVKRALALAWALSAMVSAIAGMVAGVVNGVSSGLSFFGIKVFPASYWGDWIRLPERSSAVSPSVCWRTLHSGSTPNGSASAISTRSLPSTY